MSETRTPNWFERPALAVKSIAPASGPARLAFDLVLGGWLGAGLAAHAFAYPWLIGGSSRREWFGVDQGFTTLVVAATVFGFFTFYVSLAFIWREARARITPWLVAAVTLWCTASWLVQIVPDVPGVLHDPRALIASLTLGGVGSLLFVGALALIDWKINRESEGTHG